MTLDELAISFLGRPELGALWERLSAGDEIIAPVDVVLMLLAESRAHERAGRLNEACVAATDALERATEIDDQIGVAGGLSHLAYARYRLGDTEQAVELAEQALTHAPPHAHTVTALLVQGLVALDACRWEPARERFVLARSWSAEINYPFGLMLALHNLSVVYFHTGQFDLSLTAAHDVGELNREIRYPGWANAWTRAIVSQVVGDREQCRQALADLAAIDPPAAFAAALGKMLEAQLALDEEDVERAELALATARLEAERIGSPMARAMVLLVTSRVRRARHDPASARAWIDEAIDEVNRCGLTSLEGWMRLERARVSWDMGDSAGAEAMLQETLADADRRSAAHIAAEASVLLAALTDADWLSAAARIRSGGYGFILERDRSLVVPPLAALAKSSDADLRRAGRELLDQLARVSPVPLRIQGLGTFEVRQGRRLIPASDWRKRRAGELFRFLLVQRHRRAQRDVVIEALWPDQALDRAQPLLHQATSTLRRVLEPELPEKFPSRYLRIIGESIELILPAGSTVDFESFEQRAMACIRTQPVDIDELEATVALDGGELFPDDRYADWAASLRDRLEDRAATLGELLAASLLGAGRVFDALDRAEHVLTRDPLRENAVTLAVHAALAIGDRVSAARLYRKYEQLVADELRIQPSPELRRLAAALEQ